MGVFSDNAVYRRLIDDDRRFCFFDHLETFQEKIIELFNALVKLSKFLEKLRQIIRKLPILPNQTTHIFTIAKLHKRRDTSQHSDDNTLI